MAIKYSEKQQHSVNYTKSEKHLTYISCFYLAFFEENLLDKSSKSNSQRGSDLMAMSDSMFKRFCVIVILNSFSILHSLEKKWMFPVSVADR